MKARTLEIEINFSEIAFQLNEPSTLPIGIPIESEADARVLWSNSLSHPLLCKIEGRFQRHNNQMNPPFQPQKLDGGCETSEAAKPIVFGGDAVLLGEEIK